MDEYKQAEYTLKPCPFCGGEPTIRIFRGKDVGVIDLQYYADMMRAAVELKAVYITMKQKPLKCGTGGLKMAEYIDKVEVGAKIQMMYIRREMDYGGENDFCRGMRKALRNEQCRI